MRCVQPLRAAVKRTKELLYAQAENARDLSSDDANALREPQTRLEDLWEAAYRRKVAPSESAQELALIELEYEEVRSRLGL